MFAKDKPIYERVFDNGLQADIWFVGSNRGTMVCLGMCPTKQWGYEEAWLFKTAVEAKAAVSKWLGVGDPPGQFLQKRSDHVDYPS